METKVCRKCNIEKLLTDYSMWSGRNSYRPDCKRCVADKQKIYNQNNPEYYDGLKKTQAEKYHKKRTEEIPVLEEKIGKVKYCTVCGFEGDISLFVKRVSNKTNKLNKIKLRGVCLICQRKKDKEWRDNNPDKTKAINKKTYVRRKKDEEFQKERKEYQRKKLQEDPEYRNKKQERDRINKQFPIGIWRRLLANALNQLRTVRPKQTRTLTLLGYTHETLFEIVGTKPEGNYHLDHSIPLSWMVNTTPPSIACHLDNLSWITEKDNLAKNNIYSNPVSESYFNILKTYIKPNFINRFIITDGVVYDVKKDFILEQWSKNESCVTE